MSPVRDIYFVWKLPSNYLCKKKVREGFKPSETGLKVFRCMVGKSKAIKILIQTCLYADVKNSIINKL